MGECHPLKIPIKDLPLPKELDDSVLLSSKGQEIYGSLVGSLLWASVCQTRFAICSVKIRILSWQLHRYFKDMDILEVSRYVKGTTNAKIAFKKNTGKYVELVGYSDASHGSESKRYSQDGYVFMWNGTPITFGLSETESLYCIFTYQAEIYGLSETIREAIWVRRLLKDFGFKVGTLPIYGDNQASILSAYNPSNHQTSRTY